MQTLKHMTHAEINVENKYSTIKTQAYQYLACHYVDTESQ